MHGFDEAARGGELVGNPERKFRRTSAGRDRVVLPDSPSAARPGAQDRYHVAEGVEQYSKADGHRQPEDFGRQR